MHETGNDSMAACAASRDSMGNTGSLRREEAVGPDPLTTLAGMNTLGMLPMSLIAVASLTLQSAPPAPSAPPKAPPAPKAPAAPKAPKAPTAPRTPGGPASPAAPTAPGTPAQPPAGAAPEAPAQKGARPAGFWYGVEKAPAKKPGAIRIGAYNIENVFDDKDDPSLQGEFDDIKMTTKPSRLAAIADAIRRLDADVLAIEEVESLECLTWFRDTYLKDMGYRYAYSEDVGYYRGVEQGFLSRFPITGHRTWVHQDLSPMAQKRQGTGWAKAKQGQGDKFQRSPLEVTVDVNGQPLTLVAVHFKAGGRDFAFHRESEALQTLEFVKEALLKQPDAMVAVMGDFNATPGQKTPQVFSEGGMRSAYDFRGVKSGNTKDLYTTHDSGRALDYIFMSPGLARHAVDGSFFVLSTVHPPSTYRWQDDPNKDKVPEGYASDHYPVAIDIMPPGKPGAGTSSGTKPKPAAPPASGEPAPK